MRKPYLFSVTNEVMREMTPRPVKPTSKMMVAGKRSDRRPAKRRRAAKQREYEVMIWHLAKAFVLEGRTHPGNLIDLETQIDPDLGDGQTDPADIADVQKGSDREDQK